MERAITDTKAGAIVTIPCCVPLAHVLTNYTFSIEREIINSAMCALELKLPPECYRDCKNRVGNSFHIECADLWLTDPTFRMGVVIYLLLFSVYQDVDCNAMALCHGLLQVVLLVATKTSFLLGTDVISFRTVVETLSDLEIAERKAKEALEQRLMHGFCPRMRIMRK
jgi:hypothetical protein